MTQPLRHGRQKRRVGRRLGLLGRLGQDLLLAARPLRAHLQPVFRPPLPEAVNEDDVGVSVLDRAQFGLAPFGERFAPFSLVQRGLHPGLERQGPPVRLASILGAQSGGEFVSAGPVGKAGDAGPNGRRRGGTARLGQNTPVCGCWRM